MPDDAASRWREVQRLIDGALDLPLDQRTPYLERACADDAALRDEAFRLLRACELAESTDDFLAGSAAAFAAPLGAAFTDANAVHGTDRRARLAAGIATASDGRYVLERELGRGGMATVYVARDRRHERTVAIKVLERSMTHASAARFVREVRTAANLTHPHIVGVHDSGEADGIPYYVMPLVDGETLEERLRRAGALPLTDAIRLLRDVTDALVYAHTRGIAHRDLKPANVLLSGGHALVADFGIAKALDVAEPAAGSAAGDEAAPASPALTSAGSVLGTPAYMAPEQTVGGATDARSDLYALGVVMYETLAGVHPFGERARYEMLRAHRSAAPVPLAARRRDVPPDLAALVMRLLAKDPAMRPQDAAEVLRVLEGMRVPAAHPRQRGRRTWMAVTAVVLFMLGAAAYSSWRRVGADAAPVDTEAPLGAGAQATAAVRRVAVLPLANTGGVPQDEYFSDGMTDELALALARLPGVRVAGRTSSYAFKGQSPAAQDVGEQLQVDAFVTGSVRRARDRLRVAAQLVSAGDGTLLWGDVFESRSSDVFAVQDEITAAIVTALAPSLGEGGAGAPTAVSRRGTNDQQAYDLYLRGRYHFMERGAQNLQSAVRYFRAAIARDPSFARAHAGLSLAHNVLPLYVPGADSLALVEASAARAVALDSALADARVALASARELDLRFAEAEAHYRAALALEPENATAHHWYGFFLLYTGRADDAIAHLNRATQLDPLAKSAGSALAVALMVARRFPEANAAVRRILATDSTFSIALNALGVIQAFSGAPDSAVVTLERAERIHPDAPGLQAALLFAYAAVGRWQDAEDVRSRLRARERGASEVDAAFGDREPMMRLLSSRRGRKLLHAEYGFGCHSFVGPLWSDPRYRTMTRELGVTPCAYAQPWPLLPVSGR